MNRDELCYSSQPGSLWKNSNVSLPSENGQRLIFVIIGRRNKNKDFGSVSSYDIFWLNGRADGRWPRSRALGWVNRSFITKNSVLVSHVASDTNTHNDPAAGSLCSYGEDGWLIVVTSIEMRPRLGIRDSSNRHAPVVFFDRFTGPPSGWRELDNYDPRLVVVMGSCDDDA